MKKSVFVFLCFILAFRAFAAQSNNSNFITGGTVLAGASFQTLANSYPSYPSPTTFTDVNIQNTVGVMIDHASTVYQGSKLDYTFNLQITSYSPALVPTVQNIALSVEYDPTQLTSVKDKHIFTFTNKVRVVVQILSIIDNQTGAAVVNPADIFMVKTEINIERYYNFTFSSAPSGVVITPISYAGVYEYQVAWLAQAGAEEYDLEWTWVNTYTATYGVYSSTGLYYDFRNNSSRVRISGTTFKISNIFDQGVLVVRVRGIGRNPGNWSKQVFGAWTIPNDKDLLTNLSNSPYHRYVSVVPHEPALNWQYSANYAEEGKKKEVVNYFDGSQRSRQLVTKSNTSNEVIVGESYYDHQGRKALESLPVPSKDQSPQIRFYPAFNVNTALQAYSRNDFDKEPVPGICAAPTNPFHNSQGAGNYYSQLNAFNVLPSDEGFNAYLPEASGFPFTRTEYTPDNTGRIRRLGSVGNNHQLGSGHESKYYYGKPLQVELDRLFGNEAGYSRFYKKDMVVDPNGQISISYKDLSGKVVATALSGNTPVTTYALPSTATASVSIDADLLEKDAYGKSETNRINQDRNAVVFNAHYLVSQPGVHHFSYEVTAPLYTNNCLNPGICFDCIYDLTVRITDDCGNILSEKTVFVGNPVLDNSCGALVKYSTDAVAPISLNLAVGNYQIYKALKINQGALDYYLTQMMDSTKGCFKTKAMFIAEALATVDTTGCVISCEACVAGLGTRDEFVMRGLGSEKDWELAYENCIEPCSDASKCQTLFSLMLSDVSPGGQYAQWYDTTFGRMNTATFPLSVMNFNNYLPDVSGTNSFWRNPVHLNYGPGYYKENGTRAAILVTELEPGVYYPEVLFSFIGGDGLRYVYPEFLKNESDFMLFWENSWAKSLVRYHPEYCYYEWCDVNDTKELNHLSSEDFDNLLTNTDSRSQAITLDIFPSPSIFSLLDKDPYFAAGSRGAAQKTQMQTILTSINHAGTGNSIFQIAAFAARCPGYFGTGAPPVGCTAFGTGADTNILNAEWVSLKSIYLAEKLRLQDRAAFDYVKANCAKGVNGCIGQQVYNPSMDGITGWETPTVLGDPNKICSDVTAFLYATKIKRYVNMRDMEGMTKAVADYNLFYTTGKCPEAVHLQTLLSEIAQGGILLDSFSLENKPYFIKDLYLKLNGGPSIGSVPYQYTPETSGPGNTVLTIRFKSPLTTACSLKMTLPVGYNWSQVKLLKDLGPDMMSADPGAFLVTAMVDNDGNPVTPPVELQINGTSCFKVKDCVFETSCESNAFGNDLIKLMNYMRKSTGADLFSASPVDLQNPPYAAYMTSYITNMMAPITGQRKWRFFGNKFYLYSSDVLTPELLEMEFLAFDPGTFTHSDLTKIDYIARIQPDPHNNHGFYMVAYYDHDSNPATAPLPVTLKGRINFTNPLFNDIWVLGNCRPQTPAFCQTPEHLTKNDLEPFLDRLVSSPPASTTPLAGISEWTRLLQGQLGTGNYRIGQAQSYFDSIVYDIVSDEFSPGTFKTICKLKLYRIDPYFNNRYNLSTIAELRTIVVNRDMLLDGKAFAFTILAEYPSGVTERIGGYTSCLPIKDCECNGTPADGGGGGGGGGVLPDGPDENCEAGYRVYVKAMELFNANFFGNNPGLVSQPILSREAFDCGGCAMEYAVYLQSYTGPGPLKTLFDFCTGTEKCRIRFQQYVDAVNAFNAAHPPHMAITPNYAVAGELCDCFEQYIRYLMTYTGTSAPKSIIDFQASGMCIQDDNCALLVEAYRSAILAFNSSPYRNPGGHEMQLIDIDNSMCDCILAYIQYLNAYSGGSPPLSITAFIAANLCNREVEICSPLAVIYRDAITAYNNDLVRNPSRYLLPFEELTTEMCSCIQAYANYLNTYSGGPPPLSFTAFMAANMCNPQVDICPPLDDIYRNAVTAYNNDLVRNPARHFLLFDILTPEMCICIQAYVNYLNAYSGGSPPLSFVAFRAANLCNPQVDICPPMDAIYRNAVTAYNNDLVRNPARYFLPFDVLNSEMCSCIQAYANYLNAYSGGSPPMSFMAFRAANLCNPQVDICPPLDVIYRNAVTNYNNDLVRNPARYFLPFDVLNPEMCGCIQAYANYLNSYSGGSMPLSFVAFRAANMCNFIPPSDGPALMADPPADEMTFTEENGEQPMLMMAGKEGVILENSPIYVPDYAPSGTCVKPQFIGPEYDYVNRCAEHLRQVAEVNALTKYNDYAVSFKATYALQYTESCLNTALEVFDLEYVDKTYHYTLYYYDQAGNLIRTVPPAGVNLVTSPGDFTKIIADRALNTKKFFTTHTLVTTYEYNSLNQLIKQSMPDHDKMNRWYVNASNPAGALPVNFVARTSYAVDASTTIIAGTISGEGYIFRSDDAGFNWYRVGNIQASDLNELQMIDASNGFAVGKDGLLYQTSNGGVTWKVIPGALGITSHLNDLYFKTTSNGVVVGDNGQVWVTATGGSSWTASTTPITGNITSISAFNANDLIISVNNAGEGLVYKSANFGTTWTAVNNYKTDELGDVFMISTTEGFAAGKDGVLLHTTNAGAVWKLVPTNVHLNFRKIYFKDASKGFAILESTGPGGNIYTTADGGQTWKQASTIGVYRDFTFYSASKGYAVGNNINTKGILARLDADALTVAKLGDRDDLANDLYAVHFIDANTGFVAGNNGKLFQCINATSNFMAWSPVTITAPHNTENIRKIYFNTTTVGAMVTASGRLITKNGGTYTSHNSSTQNYVNLKEGYGQLFAVDKDGYGKVWKSTASTLTSFTAAYTYTSTQNPSAASLTAVYPINATDVFVTGTKGLLLKNSTLQQDNVRALEINDVYAVLSGTTAYAAGKDGSLWTTINTGANWTKMITATSKELLTVEFINATTGLAGGVEGTLLGVSGAVVSNISIASNKHIQDIDYLNSNDVVLSGNNGLLKKSANGGTTWTDAGTNALAYNNNLSAVVYLNSTTILSVGTSGYVWKSTGTVLNRVTDLLLPALQDVHFANVKQGVLVGDKGTLLLSEDGGSGWKLLPALAGIPLTSAWRVDANRLLITDNQNKIRLSLNKGVAFTTSYTGSSILRDMAFEDATKGTAVGDNGTILYTTNGGTTWSPATVAGTVTAHLYAVQRKNHKAFIAGATGTMLTSTNSGVNWAIQTSGTTQDLYAVYFHDYNTGYVLGNNGVLRKSTDGGAIWVAKDNYNPVTSPGTQPLYTIAFNTRFDGFFAGNNYPRRLKDEADLFSSFFYYDKLGRLSVSENTKQFNLAGYVYTYTLFDYQGRLTEVGEITQTTDVRSLYPSRLMDATSFQAWISSAVSRKEVTQTYYDGVINGTLSVPGLTQQNLRKRVASTTFEEVRDANNLTYTNATHYTYDIHGNVTALVQDNPALQSYGRRYIVMEYKYDLVNGNVNSFHYQNGQKDQWHHRYYYDADNRITEVQTSRDKIIWDVDARYAYYRHGPLARTEMGDLRVQGVDYAYTLQGWLKGVNGNTLNPNEDMGHDGNTYLPHKTVARDAFGFTLGYYDGDYTPVNGMSAGPGLFVPSITGSSLSVARSNLYNGNITHMVTSIINPNTNAILPQGYAYRYDQLNRLSQMRAFDNFSTGSNQFLSGSVSGAYTENFNYDANGNILGLDRNGKSSAIAMDNLAYRYDYINNNPADGLRSNRLYHVDDAIASSYTDDIDDQGTFTPGSSSINVNAVNNYSYDELGNLVKDVAEQIAQVQWTSSGKVRKITRTPGSVKPDLEFIYDAMGKRIGKIEKPKPLSSLTQKTTWYARDVKGNHIVTYDQHYEAFNGQNYLLADERIIYGSTRLGMNTLNDTISGFEYILPVANETDRILGRKKYEGTNHLGNVLAIVSDKKIPQDINADNLIDYYLPDIRGGYDYYSFGSPMPDRTFIAKACSTKAVNLTIISYLEDFNTPFIWAATGPAMTMPDPANSRMAVQVFSPMGGTEQVIPCVPGVLSTLNLQLQFGNNSPLMVEILDPMTMMLLTTTMTYSGPFGFTIPVSMSFTAPMSGSVRVRITNPGGVIYPDMFYLKLAQIISVQTTVQTFCWDEDYRFGFGGHEKDNEMKGAGNSVDMEARMLDPRLGRMGSIDPKTAFYPGISPYIYALNTPVNAIDPDGQLVIFVNGYRAAAPGANIYREVKRNDQVFKGDKLAYWSGVDNKFMDRMNDHNAIYADGDAPTLTAGNKMGFNARVDHGRKAGQDLISKINSGEVVLQKNDKGEVIESIKVVAHSMGYAYSIGMIKELEKAGYKVEVSYNLAPENPTGGDIPDNVQRSVQYGSGPDQPWYYQDRIAPQKDIKNVDENAYIPDKNAAGENVPAGPYDSHAVANFAKWIFGIKAGENGYVAPRKDTQAAPKP